MPRLTEIGEAAFRKGWNIPPDKDLKEANFKFPNDRFALNNTFGIGEKSLVFTYNVYEVTAYAFGSRTIEIPYTEIRDLLRPGVLQP